MGVVGGSGGSNVAVTYNKLVNVVIGAGRRRSRSVVVEKPKRLQASLCSRG